MVRIPPLLLISGVVACSGCGTFFSQADYWEGRKAPLSGVWIYGGTQNDVIGVAKYASDPQAAFLFGWPYVIDLPLSFAADTIILPMTLVQQLVGRPEDEDAESSGSGDSSANAENWRTARWEQCRERNLCASPESQNRSAQHTGRYRRSRYRRAFRRRQARARRGWPALSRVGRADESASVFLVRPFTRMRIPKQESPVPFRASDLDPERMAERRRRDVTVVKTYELLRDALQPVERLRVDTVSRSIVFDAPDERKGLDFEPGLKSRIRPKNDPFGSHHSRSHAKHGQEDEDDEPPFRPKQQSSDRRKRCHREVVAGILEP